MSKHDPEYKHKTPSQIEWAMMAAYIDGEGCIRISTTPGKKVRTTILLLVIANNDPRLMVWLKNTFSGVVYSRKSPNKKADVLYHTWVVSHKHAEWILSGCLEFFVIKRDQAEVGLAHQQLRRKYMDASLTEPHRTHLRNKLSLLKGTSGWQKDDDGVLLRDKLGEAVS